MPSLLASDRLTKLRKTLEGWQPRWLSFSLLLFCLSSGVLTIAGRVAHMDRTGEIGFGDYYVLHTTVEFQKTGVIYQPPETARSLPAVSLYSPMLYVLLSVPGRLVSWENPFVGPRLIEITAFLLCVAAAASITRALVPHPWAWRWSVLLGLSTESMRGWILQIRGDFPGIFFGLISIRLLLARTRWCVLLAGAAAGFATQFKFTYVSAIVAGALWLAMQRRWQSTAEFIGAAIVASVGPYLLFLHREPQMLSQMFVLRHVVTDYRSLLRFGHALLSEPVMLLGIATLPFVALRRWTRWWLLIAYLAISLILSTALDVQAGGNINYFFEALFAFLPLAAFGALQLGRRRLGTAGLFLSGLLLIYLAEPNVVSAFQAIRGARSETADWNLHMAAIRGAFQGSHVLSTVPTATFLAPETVISEPYLLSYLDRLGLIDLLPLRKRIVDREFGIIVTAARADSWRGVSHMAPGLRSAIAETYQPFCLFEGWMFHIPRRSPDSGSAERLTAIGCVPTIPNVNDNSW
jgi:hypothetical protein